MDSLADLLDQRVGLILGANPLTRSSDHADYQVNGALADAKRRGIPSGPLATEIAAKIAADPLVDRAEAAGPGFVNVTLAASAVWTQVAERLSTPRLGLPTPWTGERIVIDYSSPNVAKEMHVGHLRTTVIGDSLARLAEHHGAVVIRQNHLGDWGTPFGMLIAYLQEDPDALHVATESGDEVARRLSELYRAARARFNAEPAFADHARAAVVALQGGDESAQAIWHELVGESKRYFNEVYRLLDVLLVDDDIAGESFYNDRLASVADELAERGVAVMSDGALCVFFDWATGRDGSRTPLIVRKTDGGYGYAATDLAVVAHRVGNLHATRLWYVVGAPQALHLRMVLDAARRAGYLPADVETTHVAFGSVLGPDGAPFKSREGQTARLIGLLNEAVDRAAAVVAAKNAELEPSALAERARQVGIGAVKYADLAVGRTRDYVFDLDRMVSLSGNTGVYLQYAHARVRSILSRASGSVAVIDTSAPMEPAERVLALRLDEFGAVLDATLDALEPHRLCAYLYDLAQAFTRFYDACPVLRAPSEQSRGNRLALCDLTARTLETGLGLLGIAAPFPL